MLGGRGGSPRSSTYALKNWHFRSEKHLRKICIYTYTRTNEPKVSFTFSFVSFVVYTPFAVAVVVTFCNGAKYCSKRLLVTSIFQNTGKTSNEILHWNLKNLQQVCRTSQFKSVNDIVILMFAASWRMFPSLGYRIAQ